MAIAKQRLGTGRILSETLSLALGQFIYVMAFGPLLSGMIAIAEIYVYQKIYSALLNGSTVYTIQNVELTLFPVFLVINAALTGALISKCIHDRKMGKRLSFLDAIQSLKISFISMLLCSIFICTTTSMFIDMGTFYSLLLLRGSNFNIDAFQPWLIGLGIVMLVLASRTAVAPACCVIERSKLASLGRSRSLTGGYRFQCAFIIATSIMIAFIPVAVAVFIVYAKIYDIIDPSGIRKLGSSAGFGFVYSIVSIALTLLYLRLREIKEGSITEDVENVFA